MNPTIITGQLTQFYPTLVAAQTAYAKELNLPGNKVARIYQYNGNGRFRVDDFIANPPAPAAYTKFGNPLFVLQVDYLP